MPFLIELTIVIGNTVVKNAINTTNPEMSAPFFKVKIISRDKFFILSSDGLYQYLTNEEVVAEV